MVKIIRNNGSIAETLERDVREATENAQLKNWFNSLTTDKKIEWLFNNIMSLRDYVSK